MRLLMAAYLELGRLRSISDLASGLFLCTLFLQFEKLSKRFVPEVVNFLANAILHLSPHPYKRVTNVPGNFPSPDFASDLCKPLMYVAKRDKVKEVKKVDLISLMMDEKCTELHKAGLLDITLSLLDRSANVYKGLEAFIELYHPLSQLLQDIQSDQLSNGLKVR
jgi:nucleolar protein 14